MEQQWTVRGREAGMRSPSTARPEPADCTFRAPAGRHVEADLFSLPARHDVQSASSEPRDSLRAKRAVQGKKLVAASRNDVWLHHLCGTSESTLGAASQARRRKAGPVAGCTATGPIGATHSEPGRLGFGRAHLRARPYGRASWSRPEDV